jgi:hypothetical protein
MADVTDEDDAVEAVVVVVDVVAATVMACSGHFRAHGAAELRK